MNILKRLFCKHDYKYVRNIEWKRSLYMCPKCGSFQYRNEIKCDGCNNIRGCVTCKNGSEWAHYEEPLSKDLDEAAEEYANSIAQHENNKLYSIDDFKAGAKWQKEQTKEKFNIETFNKGKKRRFIRELESEVDKVWDKFDKYSLARYFYEIGKEKMKERFIDKACEWLKSYRQDTPDGTGYVAGIVNDKTIEEFKQAMEK